MVDTDLVRELSAATYLPEKAMERALAAPGSIAEPVLAILDQAADREGEALTEPERSLLFWGIHVLASARDTRIHQPLMRLLRRDDDAIAAALGEDYPNTLACLVIGSFEGDAEGLLAAIGGEAPVGIARMQLFHALALLTVDGRIDREAAKAFLVRFDTERLAPPEAEEVWQGWEDAVSLIGFDDLVPRLKAARKDGRNAGNVIDWETVQETLKEARLRPKSRARFDNLLIGHLDDPVGALAHTREGAQTFQPDLDEDGFPIPERNPYRDVGRNDPCPCGSGKKFKKCCLDKVEQGFAALPPLPPGR
ncbi:MULTISPECIES: SEC-C metal-binding domain-containing protein [Methylobacterium]|uniref:SEC-C metal-binding domain-containing protein n=1 Tax=Methylobacterium TaxID=407 RepID=UPI00272E84EF|nr:SEC-C metal-binding domain-containing protein [Methylobacterium sp.]